MSSVRTTEHPTMTIRRKISGRIDEEWEIIIRDGKPVDVRMRAVIYTDGHDPIITSNWMQNVDPSDVPKSVVGEVEKHMTPRGAFN